MSWGWGWRPYVSVAQRRAKATQYAKQLEKKGKKLAPIAVSGRTIATTFWGKAWCNNLESYSDFANRLPRGRTYVRNGSVIDLQLEGGKINALVSGSEIYRVTVKIATLPARLWQRITSDCSQSIGSLMDLLQGRFSDGIMERLTRQREGLFPQPSEIDLNCSCPDWATMCKHVAAVLYGIGARLDTEPELLFKLREVDHSELIASAVDSANLDTALGGAQATRIANEDLGQIFGIDLDTNATPAKPIVVPGELTDRRRTGRKAKSKPTPIAVDHKEPKKIDQSRRLSNGTKKLAKAKPKRKPRRPEETLSAAKALQ